MEQTNITITEAEAFTFVAIIMFGLLFAIPFILVKIIDTNYNVTVKKEKPVKKRNFTKQ